MHDTDSNGSYSLLIYQKGREPKSNLDIDGLWLCTASGHNLQIFHQEWIEQDSKGYCKELFEIRILPDRCPLNSTKFIYTVEKQRNLDAEIPTDGQI